MPDAGKQNRGITGMEVESTGWKRLKLAAAVGDIDHRMLAQHATGLPGVGVAWGVLPIWNRGAARPDRLIASPGDAHSPGIIPRDDNRIAEVLGYIFCHEDIESTYPKSKISDFSIIASCKIMTQKYIIHG